MLKICKAHQKLGDSGRVTSPSSSNGKMFRQFSSLWGLLSFKRVVKSTGAHFSSTMSMANEDVKNNSRKRLEKLDKPQQKKMFQS